MRSPIFAASALFALVVGFAPAAAVTVDGHLDPDYGPALATQINGYTAAISAGPDPRDSFPFRDHSALDVLHAFVSDDSVLHVFIGGELMSWTGGNGPGPYYDYLYLLIDDQPGGQSPLLGDGLHSPGFSTQAGLRFDTAFVPDYAFWTFTSNPYNSNPYVVHGYESVLGENASTTEWIGDGPGIAPGSLAGGSNPFDVRLGIDETDTTGVPRGCTVGSGAGVSTGVEWAIPLAAIGRPTGCLKLMAYAAFLGNGRIWNQVLPPLPAGTCFLDLPAAVDFSTIPGDQFVTLCSTQVPTRTTTWGALKTHYR